VCVQDMAAESGGTLKYCNRCKRSKPTAQFTDCGGRKQSSCTPCLTSFWRAQATARRVITGTRSGSIRCELPVQRMQELLEAARGQCFYCLCETGRIFLDRVEAGQASCYHEGNVVHCSGHCNDLKGCMNLRSWADFVHRMA
jgi:hypothetical protein